MTATIEQAPLPPVHKVRLRDLLDWGKRWHISEQTAQAVGPVVRIDLGIRGLPDYVFACSPQAARDVLGGFDGSFDKGADLHNETRDAWGENLFTMRHEPWLPRRRAVQPAFTKRQVNDYGARISDIAEAMTQEWLRAGSVDLAAQARTLTLRVLGRSVLGVDFGARAHEISRHLEHVAEYPASRATLPVRLPDRLTPGYRKFQRSFNEIRTVAAEVVSACRHDASVDASLVRRLLSATDPETGAKLTDADIVAELVAFLFAGHDTTATTVAYTLWQLAQHAEMQMRVVAEVESLGDRPLTPSDLSSLPYTAQAVHEALRLCPPAAGISRLTMRDAIVDGFRVREGQFVLLSIYAMHRDPDLWDDPLRYDPDRFEASGMKTMDRWQYLPFGGGPRSCIGDHFAMLEAILAVATVIHRAELRTTADFEIAVPFTTAAKGPVLASLTPRTRRTHS